MKIDWIEIQKYYNNNHTWRDIIIQFKISSEKLLKASKNGFFKSRSKSDANKLGNIKNPRTLSEETKKKISESRIKYLKEHPEKVPYLLNHYSKGESYPERYFDEIFRNKFEYKRFLPISYYHIDFAVVDKKIAIEIDGDQHYLDKKVVESDKRKNKFLINNGWDIIRIKWSDYQKMIKIEKEEYIKKLIEYILNLINVKPEIIIKENIKNIKPETIIKEKIFYCKTCGQNKIFNKDTDCVKCAHLKQRKVKNRPNIEELLNEVKILGYCKVGRKYGVSDNTIRKWLK